MPKHEVGFGFQHFWPKTYEAFPRFWEVYPRLLDALNSLISRGYEKTDAREKVIINLGIFAGTCLSEINTLVGNGLGQGAIKIARSMLEIAINAEFLRLFPEQVDDYIDWFFVERYQLIEYVRASAPDTLSQYPKELQDEIDNDFQSVRGRFEIVKPGNKPRLRPGWCAMGLDARAVKTGFQLEYKLIYPMGNKLLHGTIGGMSMHADRSVDSDRIAVPPSLRYCKPALVGGHLCAVRIAKTISEVMSQDPSPTFDVLNRDYALAWPNHAEHDAESE